MSRRPSCKCQGCSSEHNTGSNVSVPIESTLAVVQANSQAPNTSNGEVYNAQLGDEVIGPILRAMQEGHQPTDDELGRERKEVGQLAQQWDQLIIHNQLLYQKFENAQGSHHHLQLDVCNTRSYKKLILEFWEAILERIRKYRRDFIGQDILSLLRNGVRPACIVLLGRIPTRGTEVHCRISSLDIPC